LNKCVIYIIVTIFEEAGATLVGKDRSIRIDMKIFIYILINNFSFSTMPNDPPTEETSIDLDEFQDTD
jgi:hypothetical protein